MDPPTFAGLLIGIVALFLSFFTFAGWIKLLLRVLAGVILLEFVLLAVSMPIWVRVVIGLVLFAAGVVWVVRAVRKRRQQHTKQIRAVLASVGTAVKDGRPSNLEGRDVEIITSHFPGIAEQVKAWDVAAKGVDDSKGALRATVEQELRKLHADEWPYEFESLRDGLCSITENRIAEGAASTQPLPPMTGFESQKPVFEFFYSDELRRCIH